MNKNCLWTELFSFSRSCWKKLDLKSQHASYRIVRTATLPIFKYVPARRIVFIISNSKNFPIGTAAFIGPNFVAIVLDADFRKLVRRKPFLLELQREDIWTKKTLLSSSQWCSANQNSEQLSFLNGTTYATSFYKNETTWIKPLKSAFLTGLKSVRGSLPIL